MTLIRFSKRKSTFDFANVLRCSHVLTLLFSLLLPTSATCYSPLLSFQAAVHTPRTTTTTSSSSLHLSAVNGNNAVSNLDRELQRARKLLEKSKAKLAARQQQQQQPGTSIGAAGSCGSPSSAFVPYFAAAAATTTTTTGKKRVASRDGIVKSRCEKTGQILADGERMAEISEQEEWEIRSIDQVFQNEENDGRYNKKDLFSLASQQLAERDVAASIWNLRQKMHTEDYQKIFDKKNHFIGEDS